MSLTAEGGAPAGPRTPRSSRERPPSFPQASRARCENRQCGSGRGGGGGTGQRGAPLSVTAGGWSCRRGAGGSVTAEESAVSLHVREVVVVGCEKGEVALKAGQVVCPQGLECANLEDIACGRVPKSSVTTLDDSCHQVWCCNDSRAVASAPGSRLDESGTRRPTSDSSI